MSSSGHPTFLTMGDEPYFETINLSAQLVHELYPHSKFMVYDWGFNHEQVELLKEFDWVELRDWTFKELDFLLDKKDQWFEVYRAQQTKQIKYALINYYHTNNFWKNFIIPESNSNIRNTFLWKILGSCKNYLRRTLLKKGFSE